MLRVTEAFVNNFQYAHTKILEQHKNWTSVTRLAYIIYIKFWHIRSIMENEHRTCGFDGCNSEKYLKMKPLDTLRQSLYLNVWWPNFFGWIYFMQETLYTTILKQCLCIMNRKIGVLHWDTCKYLIPFVKEILTVKLYLKKNKVKVK